MHHDGSLMASLVHLLVTGVSVFLVAQLLPGIRARSLWASISFAFVAGILHALAWSVFAPLTLPFKWLTLGVGGFIVNGLVFLIAGRIVGGVKISGCFMAAIAAVCVTFVDHGIYHLLRSQGVL
jgi:putative membrane protein